MPATINLTFADATYEAPAVYLGQGLAVHRPLYRGDVLSKQPKRWAITHVATGCSACSTFRGTKQNAVKLAKLWDNVFARELLTSEDAVDWPRYQEWRDAIAYAQRGQVMAPMP